MPTLDNRYEDFAKQHPEFYEHSPVSSTASGMANPAYKKPDVAEANASKELGRLAVFMQQNFPSKMDGRLVVDVMMEILKGPIPILFMDAAPMGKEFSVQRLTNHSGNSHLVIITDPAVEDIHIGSVVIVPYAEGFKDPIRVVAQINENGLPKLANERFAIVLEFIYD